MCVALNSNKWNKHPFYGLNIILEIPGRIVFEQWELHSKNSNFGSHSKQASIVIMNRRPLGPFVKTEILITFCLQLDQKKGLFIANPQGLFIYDITFGGEEGEKPNVI